MVASLSVSNVPFKALISVSVVERVVILVLPDIYTLSERARRRRVSEELKGGSDRPRKGYNGRMYTGVLRLSPVNMGRFYPHNILSLFN